MVGSSPCGARLGTGGAGRGSGALVLAGCSCSGPALGPGFLLVRDMVWVPDLALRPDFLGLGLGAAARGAVRRRGRRARRGRARDAAAEAGARRSPWPPAASAPRGCWTGDDEPAGLVVRLVAVTVYGWNALVAERLLMGAWPLLVGYAVLPWLLDAGPAVAGRTDRLPARAAGAGTARLPERQRRAGHGGRGARRGAAGKGRTVRPPCWSPPATRPGWSPGCCTRRRRRRTRRLPRCSRCAVRARCPARWRRSRSGGIWNTEPCSRTRAPGCSAGLALVALAGPGRRSAPGPGGGGRRRASGRRYWSAG